MAPLPVIDGVFRVALRWTSATAIQPVNVLHFLTATGDATDLATALNAHMTSTMFGATSSQFTLTSLEIIALDGTTAVQTFEGPLFTGQDTSQMVPAASVVVSFHTAQRGPRGRGRCYTPPVGESSLLNGVIAGGDADAIAEAWRAFHDDMRGNFPVYTPVVASYVHADANEITSVRCDIPVGTQRRRQDAVAGR